MARSCAAHLTAAVLDGWVAGGGVGGGARRGCLVYSISFTIYYMLYRGPAVLVRLVSGVCLKKDRKNRCRSR